MKKKSRKILILSILCSLLLFFSGCTGQSNHLGSNNTISGKLEVHFIDVGQGDATLIKCEDEYMLIDAGDNTCGTKVQNYLKKQGVKNLKYVVGTHPGADHIGGMDVIIYKFDCEKIFLTDKADVKSQSTKSYQELLDTISAKSLQRSIPQVGETYSLGGGIFTVLSPSKAYEDSNDASIVLKFTYGDTAFLFTGDATEKAEQDMLASDINLQADVYKVGHHGSNSSSCRDFIKAINPTYAVISCGEGNSYGHPTNGTLQKLKNYGCLVFRTDEQGTIIAVSDGKTVSWSCEPSTTWNPGIKENAKEDTRMQQEGTTESLADDLTYVLNTKSKKFHRTDCGSISAISTKNRQDVNWSREECVNQGYLPCGSCNP